MSGDAFRPVFVCVFMSVWVFLLLYLAFMGLSGFIFWVRFSCLSVRGGARNGNFGKCLVRTCAAQNIFKQKAPLNTSLYSFDQFLSRGNMSKLSTCKKKRVFHKVCCSSNSECLPREKHNSAMLLVMVFSLRPLTPVTLEQSHFTSAD